MNTESFGKKIKQAFTLDDFLIAMFLLLTIWHLAHVLAAFEPIKELAWPVAMGIDIGIARAAWVTSNRSIPIDARKLAAAWLIFLLVYSFGLNAYYYGTQGAGQWSYALAALYPMSLALAGGVKSFLDQKKAEIEAQTITSLITPLPVAKPARNSKAPAPQSDHLAMHGASVAPVSLASLPEPVTISSTAQALDKLLSDAKISRQEALSLLKKYGITTAESAYRGLRFAGYVPAGMTLEEFQPLYAELVAKPGKKPIQIAEAGKLTRQQIAKKAADARWLKQKQPAAQQEESA